MDRLRSVRVERVGNPARLLRRHAAEAIVPPGDILAFVAWGMDREMREVFGLVRSKLEQIAEEQDDADADDLSRDRPERRRPGW